MIAAHAGGVLHQNAPGPDPEAGDRMAKPALAW